MSLFRRMVVIPEDEYNQLKQKLTLTSPDMPVDRQQLMQAIELHEQRQKADYQQPVLAPLDETNILRTLESVPSNYQNRARALLHLLKNKPDFRWTETGELENFPGSHIADLINYAVRDKRRTGTEPVGWYHFLQLIQHTNLPKSVLGIKTLNELATAPRTFTWDHL